MVTAGVFTTGRTVSYCIVADVQQVLAGYDLSMYLEAEALSDRIATGLARSREAVEQHAGRDFIRHEQAEVVLDGNGSDRLLLNQAGVWPPVTVHAVTVQGRELDEAEWVCYPTLGVLRLTERASNAGFPAGVQNVGVRVSWGHETVPEAVIQAQAKLTAAEILAEASGDTGGVTAMRIGDYAVNYGREGRYASAVGRLCDEALAALAAYRVLRLRVV